jgi:hypothetical protein
VVPKLADIQRSLYRLIVSPSGVENALKLSGKSSCLPVISMIRSEGRLSAVERLDIYANMYFYRLLEAIKQDFPTTLRIVGDVNFHNLLTQYLIDFPPEHPSINEASRHLAAFADHSSVAREFPFLPDLIRLERALVEAFLSRDAEPLTPQRLHGIPVSKWGLLRFGLHPAVQLLSCEWRVDDLVRAIQAGRAPDKTVLSASTILVWRHDFAVSYRAIDRIEARILRTLCSGQEFELACDAIKTSNENVSPETMSNMLLCWIGDGILVAVGDDAKEKQ